MKYWNKNKKAREHWTKIEGPAIFLMEKMKHWCQQNESDGRFYFEKPNLVIVGLLKPSNIGSGPTVRSKRIWLWYFEYPEDAVIFRLTWSTI